MNSKKGLGKGLNALFSESKKESSEKKVNDSLKLKDYNDTDNLVIDEDINNVYPNKRQPRKSFDEDKLKELAGSIYEMGIIQPLIVRKNEDGYEIIAGERRWRAARLAGLKTVPVIVKDFDEMKRLEAALIENVQRENLNPIEEAVTYKRFSEEFNLNQEEIAVKVGKSRAAVANAVRLLNLDIRVQNFLREGKITSGHARSILSLNDNDKQFEFAEKIIEEQLSVRESEEIARTYNVNKIKESKTDEKKNDNTQKNEVYKSIEKTMNNIFGTKVNIKNGKNKGRIEIEYYSQEELDRIVCLINKLESSSNWFF